MDRQALADFLKRRRLALQPVDVGLQPGQRRRTAGLRREEVAGLAHMSTDFYARLEQQRGSRPSQQTVLALTQALRLSGDEEDHLYSLAGHTPPPRARRSNQASVSLQRVLDQLDTPAMIVSDLYVTLSQNEMAKALQGTQTSLAFEDPRRNLIYRWFTQPSSRELHPLEDHGKHSRSYVASLRSVYGRLEGDPEVRDLVDVLHRESAEFAQLWEHHEVAKRPFTRKRFVHPVAGLITLDCQILNSENFAERLVVFTPAEPEDARLLETIRP